MNVFIPAQKELNPFFDEIMKYSNHNFIFDSYKKYDSSFKTVIIHWPEQIFNWKEPSIEELMDLERCLALWRLKSKIIYLVHNLERHNGMTDNYKKLYKIIEENCDYMVHMGNYSYNLFESKYPTKKHEIIYHSLYKNSFKVYTKEFARKRLDICNEAMVMIAPGSIRNMQEFKLVLTAFKALKTQNKILIVPRMLEFNLPFEFKGRTFLKRFVDIKKWYILLKKRKYKKPVFYFNYSFLERNELALLMSASDIVFIPRIKILNSGNVFLALTYKKIMVGPNQGNLKEIFELFKLPYFNPIKQSSVQAAMKDAYKLFKFNTYSYETNLLHNFHPSVLAAQWDSLIDEQSF